jgi:hypothetical protein
MYHSVVNFILISLLQTAWSPVEVDGRLYGGEPGAIEILGMEMAGEPTGSFRKIPAEESGLDGVLGWGDIEKNIKQFLFMNPFGGICTGDYDGDGLADIYVPAQSGGSRLYRNLGGFKFADVSVMSGIFDESFWGAGACFVDIDNDGDVDIYACGYDMANRLFVNDGLGKFVERAAEFGLDYKGGSMMMSFADVDLDGDLDGYLATTAVEPPAGTKFQVRFVKRASDGVEYPVVVDELKEYWDLIILPDDTAQRVESGQYDHYFRNDSGKFVDVTKAAGIDGAHFSLSATWWDFDADLWPDVYVSNDYKGPDILYKNLRDGTFENVIGEAVAHTPWFSMGSDAADLNGDGLIDFFATDMAATTHYREKVMMGSMDDQAWFLDWAEPRQFMRNAVYLNSGTGRMQEAAFLTGLASTDWTWTPDWRILTMTGQLIVSSRMVWCATS